MNKISLYLALCLLLAFTACDDDDEEVLDGNWVAMADFEGYPRTEAVSFVIGESAYIGTGFDGDDRLNDIWKYNHTNDSWEQVADLPDSISSAVAFGTSTHGYVGTGYNDLTEELSAFYEYDPTTNSWTSIADFAGGARYGAVAFSIDNIGYVGTGYDGDQQRTSAMYKYTPSTGEWTQVASAKKKCTNASTFVINGKGYICTGYNNSYVTEFYEYDPSTDAWTERVELDDVKDESFDNDYDEIYRQNAVAFAVDGYGYITTGSNGSALKTVWEYSPADDRWEEKTELEGSSRVGAVSFVVGGKAYVATGSSASNSSYYDDVWMFEPWEEQDDDDN